MSSFFSSIASSSLASSSSSSACHLLRGHFAEGVQIYLMLIASFTLIYKRLLEPTSQRRRFRVWFLDISKQGISSVVIHFCNIFLAMVFSQLSSLKEQGEIGDECAFYFLGFLFDTIFGVCLIWMLLHTISIIAKHHGIEALAEQGDYGYPIRFRWYLAQLLTFVAVCFLSKMVIGLSMLLFAPTIARLGNRLFHPIAGEPKLELVVVMVAAPAGLSAIQYWIQDNILSGSKVALPGDYKYLDFNTQSE